MSNLFNNSEISEVGEYVLALGNDAGALWDETTPVENLAELQRVIDLVSASELYHAVRLPSNRRLSFQGDIVLPGNVKLLGNGSTVVSLVPNNQLFDITGSNTGIYDFNLELTEGHLQRAIKVNSGVNTVMVENVHAMGSVDPATAGANSFIEFIRSEDGEDLMVKNCSAKRMRYFHRPLATRKATIMDSYAEDMGGPFAWITGAAEDLTYIRCMFNRHLFGRILNNGLATEGETSGPQKLRISVIDCTFIGVEGVQFDFQKDGKGAYILDPVTGARIPEENGASGDMVVFRNCKDSNMIRTKVYHSGEFGYDLVHGSENCKIIDCHAEEISGCAITVGSRYINIATLALQTPATRCQVMNFTCKNVCLNQNSKVPDGSLSAIRVERSIDCTIGSITIDGVMPVAGVWTGSGVGMSYSTRIQNMGGHVIRNVRLPIETTVPGSVTFTDGFGHNEYSQRFAAAFTGGGELLAQEQLHNMVGVADSVATGTYRLTTETPIPDNPILSVRVQASTIKYAEMDIIDPCTIEVRTYNASNVLSNSIFHVIIETHESGFLSRPIVIDCLGEIYDTPEFWNIFPTASACTSGVRVRATNFVGAANQLAEIDFVLRPVFNNSLRKVNRWVPIVESIA